MDDLHDGGFSFRSTIRHCQENTVAAAEGWLTQSTGGDCSLYREGYLQVVTKLVCRHHSNHLRWKCYDILTQYFSVALFPFAFNVFFNRVVHVLIMHFEKIPY